MLFTLFFLVCCLVLNLLVLAKVITTLHLFIFTQHGACVNAMDLWQFTPLHEAASKNRVEVCSLLLSYGADPTLFNCHNKSAIDLAPTALLKERLACKHVTATKTNSHFFLDLTGCRSLLQMSSEVILCCRRHVRQTWPALKNTSPLRPSTSNTL